MFGVLIGLNVFGFVLFVVGFIDSSRGFGVELISSGFGMLFGGFGGSIIGIGF